MDLTEEELKATRNLLEKIKNTPDDVIEKAIDNLAKTESEKTADEMFLKLGYAIKIDNEEEIKYLCIGNEDVDIRFFKKYKVIAGYPTYDYFCNMPLLQAINKKCKELRWL